MSYSLIYTLVKPIVNNRSEITSVDI